jgi:hypothetical protein
MARSTARRWVAKCKDETKAAKRAANSVASSATTGAPTGQQSGVPAPLDEPVSQSAPPSENAWLCPSAHLQRDPDVTPHNQSLRGPDAHGCGRSGRGRGPFLHHRHDDLISRCCCGRHRHGVRYGGPQVGWHAWLAHHWKSTSLLLRAALTLLIVILAVINAVGVYGRLTAAHLTVHAATMAATEQQGLDGRRPASRSRPMLSATSTGASR